MWGGHQSLEIYRIWEFHERRTMDVFGTCFTELPRWLSDDLIKLVGMHAWHEVNKNLPSAAGVKSIEDL